MRLSPNASTSNPEFSRSRDRSGNSPDRNGGDAHRVGTHKGSEDGVESGRVGSLHLPVTQQEHSQIVHDAIRRREQEAEKRGGVGGLGTGLPGRQNAKPGQGSGVHQVRKPLAISEDSREPTGGGETKVQRLVRGSETRRFVGRAARDKEAATNRLWQQGPESSFCESEPGGQHGMEL